MFLNSRIRPAKGFELARLSTKTKRLKDVYQRVLVYYYIVSLLFVTLLGKPWNLLDEKCINMQSKP